VGDQVETPGSQEGIAASIPTLTWDDLASLWARFASSIIDSVLQAIPTVGFVTVIINWVMFRRGHSIGMKVVGTRIIRKNGDLSGFFHTSVRSFVSFLSFIPLGLGFWWVFWDPWKQTWHDKIMSTYVVRNTDEISNRRGTSAGGAVAAFWIVLLLIVVFFVSLIATVGE